MAMFRVKKMLSVCLSNVFDNLQINCICQFVLSCIKMDKLEYRGVSYKIPNKTRKNSKNDSGRNIANICEWSKLFKLVENSLDDDLRPGRPVDTITLDVIEKTKYLVLEDLRLKERQLAPLLGVSETTVFRILHEYLGMKKASARWVPRMLSQFQMRVRMEMCEHFLTNQI
jgi:AraC-like DNA-binding protein